MDPPRVPAGESEQLNAILAQLTQMNAMLASQQQRLDVLEQVNNAANNNLPRGLPSRVGTEGQDNNTLSRGDPTEIAGDELDGQQYLRHYSKRQPLPISPCLKLIPPLPRIH